MTSQGNGEKEMSEIIWGYLEKKISLINRQNHLELLQLYKPNSSETHQCFCIFTTRLKNVLRGADCCQHKHCYLVQLYGLAHFITQPCNSFSCLSAQQEPDSLKGTTPMWEAKRKQPSSITRCFHQS